MPSSEEPSFLEIHEQEDEAGGDCMQSAHLVKPTQMDFLCSHPLGEGVFSIKSGIDNVLPLLQNITHTCCNHRVKPWRMLTLKTRLGFTHKHPQFSTLKGVLNFAMGLQKSHGKCGL